MTRGKTRTTGTRKRWILWIVGVVLISTVVAATAKVQVDRLDREALMLAETGKAAIVLLQKLGAGVKAGDPRRILDAYDEDYEGGDDGPWQERLRAEHHGVRVFDWAVASPHGSSRQGVSSRQDAAGRFTELLAGVETLEMAKLKLAAVEEIPAPGQAVVRSVLWLRGERAGGEAFESQAKLRLWLVDRGRGFRITRHELLGGRTVTGRRQGFTDVTGESGIDFAARHNPLFDTPEWTPERFEIIRYGSAGVSAADYDGDGWYDVFFGDGAAARLYRNRGDGTFEDATAAAGLPTDLGGVNVGLFADLDNDGDRDLFLGRFTGDHRLYRNEGDGTFSDVTAGAGLGGTFTTVAAAGDADGDGLLDLYLGRYLDPRTQLPTTLFYTRNGQGNVLLRNTGGLRFEDVTAAAGVREGTILEDFGSYREVLGYAGSGWKEYGDRMVKGNSLLVNDGAGRFTDVAEAAGANPFGWYWGTAHFDYDNDGWQDVYAANGWITAESHDDL